MTITLNGTSTVFTDSSGNVGIGTTSPTQRLHVYSAATTLALVQSGAASGSGAAYIDIKSDANAGSTYYRTLRGLDASNNTRWAIGQYGSGEDVIGFYTGTSLTERMRIDSSGYVGIGNQTLFCRLGVYASGGFNSLHLTNSTNVDTGGYLNATGSAELMLSAGASYNSYSAPNFVMNAKSTIASGIYQTGDSIRFWVNTGLTAGTTFNQAERMRLDSSGNLLIGTTNASGIAGEGLKILDTGRASITVASYTTAGNSNWVMYSTGAAAYRFYVTWAGAIYATSTSITAISDLSLKTNIRPLETGLAEVMRLKPRRFDWKEETKIGQTNVAGFIAQEVQEVLPDLVYDYKYSDTETKLGIKMGDMLPTVVKALQEAVAKIDELSAEVAALKAKVS